MKKKLLAIFTASLTLLTLFGCNKTAPTDAISSEATSTETSEVVSEETKEVTSLSQVQPMEGFTDRMDDILVRYDWQIGNTVLTTDNTVEDLIQTIQDFYGYADEDIFYSDPRTFMDQIEIINSQIYGSGADYLENAAKDYKDLKEGNPSLRDESWALEIDKALNSRMWISDDIFSNTANTDYDCDYLFDTNTIEIREIPLVESPNSGYINGKVNRKTVDELYVSHNFARMRIYPEKTKGLADGSCPDYTKNSATPFDVVYDIGTHKILFIGYFDFLDMLDQGSGNHYDYDADIAGTSVYYRKAGEYAGEIRVIDTDLYDNPIEPKRHLDLQ
ncbi:MAG: hypothetical protein K5879_00930 [Lachnospiraceae bacterium]|nr:hypothetical protein [Lachnospiraceae bacterium]